MWGIVILTYPYISLLSFQCGRYNFDVLPPSQRPSGSPCRSHWRRPAPESPGGATSSAAPRSLGPPVRAAHGLQQEAGT